MKKIDSTITKLLPLLAFEMRKIVLLENVEVSNLPNAIIMSDDML